MHLNFPNTERITFPQTESNAQHNLGMPADIKKVLAKNLRALMESTPALDSYPKISRATLLGLGTISRIINAESAASIDTVEVLARAFGRSPAELLRTDLDNRLDILGDTASRLAQLAPDQREHALALLNMVIEQAEKKSQEGDASTVSFSGRIEPEPKSPKKRA